MDGPEVRYAQTSDGVSIAYSDEGEGVPVLRLIVGSHLLHNHRLAPLLQIEREFMVARYRYIPMDVRGMGASQRGIDDYSLPTRLADIEAVLDTLGLDTAVPPAHPSLTANRLQ